MDIEQLCRAVRNPGDLRNLPNYVDAVNPAATGLKRVIWPYGFHTEIPCALTNCRTRHKSGVIIELEDGSISNIGNICGGDEDKFSTKFTSEMRAMSESRRRESLMPLLLDRDALQKIESDVRAMCDAANRWVRLNAAFADMFPEVDREIRRRIAVGASLTVAEDIERSGAEIDDIVASGRARSREEARYAQVAKGTIAGVPVLGLSAKALRSMEARTNALLAANPQEADIASLQKLFNDATYLPEDVQSLKRACVAGETFYSGENFKLMAYLPGAPETRRRLDRLARADLEDRSKQIDAKDLGIDHPTESGQTVRMPTKKDIKRQRYVDAQIRAAQQLNKKW
ncbi:hypothetical protein [Paraburkholderia sacchari]|uniref:hypothetical protein n=1 Tax=Paraburkholderia sacchari TaxID=159450 RepID=UPI001BCFFEE3|nr:hypothetical protein [Paraburkholderia sacchari]